MYPDLMGGRFSECAMYFLFLTLHAQAHGRTSIFLA